MTVIGRNAANLASLVRFGASAAKGDLQDILFLTKTFQSADAVYLILPPFLQASDVKQISITIAEGYSTAIKRAG